ncbi:DUF3310 domain-containing protein [Macrococcus animalis]|uniref:DUF3310 domain-containing protein n=1 Tax=Macrococcus animalis TaxID=3395467 RepID=UPI0039BE7D1F
MKQYTRQEMMEQFSNFLDAQERATIIEEQQTFTPPHDVNSEILANIERPEDYPESIDPDESVDHPSHYNTGDIEVINMMEQIARDYEPDVAVNISNVVKYISRANHKGNLQEDLRKAQWYLNRAVDMVD